MRYLRLGLFIYLFFIASCSDKVESSRSYYFACNSRGNITATLWEILISPKRFDDKFVDVTGFYHSGLEKSFISLSEVDQVGVSQKKVNLHLPGPEMLVKKSSDKHNWDQKEVNNMSGKKIRVIGRFIFYKDLEKDDPYMGLLKNVCLIEIFE